MNPTRAVVQYGRNKEHDADALLLLDYFMQLEQNAPDVSWPSTAELQKMEIFGLRPVNRIGDLKKGKFNHHSYDFEMISCGRGVYRWRLHWPNRAGFPKSKNQTVLPLEASSAKAIPDSSDWFERVRGPRPSSSPSVENLPLFERLSESGESLTYSESRELVNRIERDSDPGPLFRGRSV